MQFETLKNNSEKKKGTVSERKKFLEKEKKYLAHFHKQLKPATYIIKGFVFRASEFNIRFFN